MNNEEIRHLINEFEKPRKIIGVKDKSCVFETFGLNEKNIFYGALAALLLLMLTLIIYEVGSDVKDMHPAYLVYMLMIPVGYVLMFYLPYKLCIGGIYKITFDDRSMIIRTNGKKEIVQFHISTACIKRVEPGKYVKRPGFNGDEYYMLCIERRDETIELSYDLMGENFFRLVDNLIVK